MKNVYSVLRSQGLPMKAALVAASTVASSAFADVSADIAAAEAAGVSNVTLAVGAVIAIAAIVLGVSIIRSLLSR